MYNLALDGTQTRVQSPPQYSAGYFANLTFNTESKSAIFEFSVGGGGYFAHLTFNTESKSAIFEFSGGGGVLCKPNLTDLISEVSDSFHFRGGGTLEWGYFADFEPKSEPAKVNSKSEPLEKPVAPQIVSPPIGGGD